jgi:stearoyl-CoA desaturase (delta-9 desaturase)
MDGGGVRRHAEPDAVHAVIYNRMHVLRAYALQVVAPVLDYELRGEPHRAVARTFRKLIIRSPVLLDAPAQRRLHALLETYPVLRTVHECQEQLRQLWDTANAGNHDVAGMFKNWCARAEASGIQALANFASAINRLSLIRRQRSRRTHRDPVCADVQP